MLVHRIYRVTVFVPPGYVDSLLDGVVREVPLTYGQYDRSAWWSAAGVEQFRPLPGSTPTVGKPGQVERVPTVRLEFAIPRDPSLAGARDLRRRFPGHGQPPGVIMTPQAQPGLARRSPSSAPAPMSARRCSTA
jgi:hypothetical protein